MRQDYKVLTLAISVALAPWIERAAHVLVIVIMLAPFWAVAQTQRQTNHEACRNFERVDAELNQVYSKVLAEYEEDAVFIRKLKAAQHAWIAFRDAHVESLYPEEDNREYGSGYPMCACAAKSGLTVQRTDALKRWLKGVEEGDVCAGSIRFSD
jgi:uncharacterized protein YecT (DUF1311 family)